MQKTEKNQKMPDLSGMGAGAVSVLRTCSPLPTLPAGGAKFTKKRKNTKNVKN
jgi:hypothetical protein